MGTGRVSGITGASERTVRRVAAEPGVEDPPTVAAAATARVGRPSKMTPFVDDLRRWLAELDADPAIEVVVSHDIAATKASGMEAY